MSRAPSAETQLRNAMRELRRVGRELLAEKQRCDHYRIRAARAEQDAAEWRKRFDELLFQRGKP